MDLYAILGLGQGASVADIKRAYRRLARRYHPGINPGDRAAEVTFLRITEAYETLVDPARRQHYDTTGNRSATPPQATQSFEFAGFDFSVAAHGAQAATFTELFAEVLHPIAPGDGGRPEPGAELHATLTLPFLDAMRGVQRQVIVTRQDVCPACQGSGHVTAAEARCAQCHATGSVRWARGHMVFSKPCPACAGTGRLRQQRCAVCAAQGRIVRSEAVPVAVPPGTADGARLRVSERGHAGRHGGRTGDLYITVQVVPHPHLQREGDDLVMRVPLAVHEAVLGARIEIPTPDGGVRLRVPPGTQAGRRLRLSGRGYPTAAGERGDLVIEIQLVLPEVVDERSKDLMREFGRINGNDVRKELEL